MVKITNQDLAYFLPRTSCWMFVTLWWQMITQSSLFFYTPTWSWFPGQKSVNIHLLKSKNTLFGKESYITRVSQKYLPKQFKHCQDAKINTTHSIQVVYTINTVTVSIRTTNKLGCGSLIECLSTMHAALGLTPTTSKQQQNQNNSLFSRKHWRSLLILQKIKTQSGAETWSNWNQNNFMYANYPQMHFLSIDFC